MTPTRLAIWALNAALFVLCCFLAAGLINSALAEWLVGGPIVPPPPAASAPPPPARDWAQRQAILDRNLFQVSTLLPATPLAETVETEEDLEATRLPVKLLGTVAASDQKAAWAAIEDQQSHKQDVVRVNDTLLEKATVLRIERRRIVIQNGANREELALDEDQNAPPSRPVAARVPTAAPTAPEGLRERIRRLSDSSFEVGREQVAETMRNPAELFSEARILPKYENGQMTGVQVSSIKPGSLFEDIGIQDGDTVTQVNGITVTSPQDSAALLRELTESTDFQVNVLGADGQTRTLHYSIGE